MDVGSVTSPVALDAMALVWAEPAGEAPPLSAEYADAAHGQPAETTEPAPHAPATRADNSLEAAALQTVARPHAPQTEPARPADAALPSADHAASDFAVPADQLIPVALVGLQVEPAWSWTLPQHGAERAALHGPRHADAESSAPTTDRDGHEARDDDGAAQGDEEGTGQGAERRGACTLIPEETAEQDWRGPLTCALGRALAARSAPPALLAAAGEWQRGRCVVLACPQGIEPTGPAWAFVLWPRPRAKEALDLFGVRVEAQLHWSDLAHDAPWVHVRSVKEHHPRRGRQLVALDTDGGRTTASSAVPCEVQLGPVLARTLRHCDVRLRINAVRRFWSALGGQWSVNVAVCSRPLAGERAPMIVEAT